MHALTFKAFGGPDVLEWTKVADPIAGEGQAIVRIKAAGLNYADIYRRRGDYHMDATPPWILGYEGAGEVVAIGRDADAHGIAVGDRVGFADSPRANAELVPVPIEKLIPLPDFVSFEMAAAILLQGLTAQYLVRDSYKVRRGDVAIVHAAAGGVGVLLTQMLAAAGASVVALASSEEKRQTALKHGAVVAYGNDEDWPSLSREHFGRGADVVFESVGSTLPQSMAAVRTGGTIVFYGFAGGNPPPIDPRALMDRSLTITGGDLWNVLTSSEARRSRAADLFSLVRSGALQPIISARIPMGNGADAHRRLEGRRTTGKIVLTL